MTSLNLSQETLEKITSSLTTLVELLKPESVKEEKPVSVDSMRLFNYNLTLDEFRELIKLGANVNIQDAFGRTPLHCITIKEKIKILIESGANINIQNKNGDTPLHFTSSEEKIKILLKAGADLTIKNKEGLTPKEKWGKKRSCEDFLLILNEFIKEKELKELFESKETFTKEEVKELLKRKETF